MPRISAGRAPALPNQRGTRRHPLGIPMIGCVTAAIGLHQALLAMTVVAVAVAAAPAVRNLPREATTAA